MSQQFFYIYDWCSTQEQRERGLQNVHLGMDECCVFSYDSKVSPVFWGKNTLDDLYVSLLDEWWTVIDCQKINAMSLEPVSLRGFGKMAIETRVPIELGAEGSIEGDRPREMGILFCSGREHLQL